MQNKNSRQSPSREAAPRFRSDGSFCFSAFIRAPQVIGGFLFILFGLLLSYVFTHFVILESSALNMLLLLFCCFTCFSGANSILQYLNGQHRQ